jgi:hypothetical protein
MEKVGVDKVGCGVVLEVGACNSAYENHDILPMEVIMGSIQQPPPHPFTFRDLCWQVELQRTPKHDIETYTIWKRLYMVHVPWVKVPNFLVGEENRGDVQCRFIKKDHRMNSISKHPKPNNYRKNMKIT